MSVVGENQSTTNTESHRRMDEGAERVVTETGAGQWGSALAMASAFFDLKC
jgi:tryptophan synthase beta chain